MSDRMFGMNKWMKVLAYTVLGIYTVVVAYPILFMFFTSFKSNKEFFVNLFGLPQNVEIMNYAKAWSVGKLGTYFGNSVVVTEGQPDHGCIYGIQLYPWYCDLHLPLFHDEQDASDGRKNQPDSALYCMADSIFHVYH